MTAAIEPECDAKSGLSISIRFITDRCVATRVSSREEAEWPPHPGRIFMAMAAAFFESEGHDDDKQLHRKALDWLASIHPPAMRHVAAERRSSYTCYVPVNDNPKPNKAMLQSAPGLPRLRQPRTFPTVIPDAGEIHVQLAWDCGEVPAEYLAAIDAICRDVIRIGHSSSLVMMWADGQVPAEIDDTWLVPTDGFADTSVRVPTTGELDRLEVSCGADRIDAFAAMAERIATSKGKEKNTAKAEFEAEFGEPYKSSLRPPEPLPPTIGTWRGYKQVANAMRDAVANTYFERELLIFKVFDGPSLNIERGLGLTRALRDKAMSACPIQPPPEWLSGHSGDGSPSRSPHAAFIPLPFAGRKWADGHIMGVAIALPFGVSAEERGECLGPLIVDQTTGEAQPIPFRLWGSKLPDLEILLCQEPSPPRTLQNETWTHPSRVWKSVTPVVLDQFPKPAKADDRSKWLDDVRCIVAKSCERAGLPIPQQIHVNTTAFVRGIPRSSAKKRRRKGQNAASDLGDGFPSFGVAKEQAPRPQLHVQLEFDQPVAGPVIIGAGRFAGYGLCLPESIEGRSRQSQQETI